MNPRIALRVLARATELATSWLEKGFPKPKPPFLQGCSAVIGSAQTAVSKYLA